MAKRKPGEPDQQFNADAYVGRQFAVGCLVLIVAFLLLTAAVWFFWTH